MINFAIQNQNLLTHFFRILPNHINHWTGRPYKSVTIGEGMQNRVNPAAKDLGSETLKWPEQIKDYDPYPNPTQEGLQYNQKWIEMKIQQDYYIYDIGPKGSQPVSPYYNLELNTIINYPNTYNVYHFQRIQTIRVLIIYK